MGAGEQGDDGFGSFTGQFLLGQYRVERLLGQGGMAKVYLAEQSDLNRKAAIKILAGEGRSKEQQARFRREAQVASHLVHPNITTIYNFGELPQGQLFIAMEYVEGPRLGEVLEKSPLPAFVVVDLAFQLVQALAYAHDRGVVHRDLKPDNIIITRVSEKLHAKVLDFGLARLEDGASLTRAGKVMGTPRYMSPEQCRGEVCTPLSDQYAFGLVLYEMLTGEPAMVSDTALGYIYLHQNQIPPAPSEVRRDSELELLDPIVARALAKDPAERFGCMAEIGEALLAVVGQARTAGLGATRTIEPGAGSSGQHFAVTSELLSRLPEDLAGEQAQQREEAARAAGARVASVQQLGPQPMVADAARRAVEAFGLQLTGHLPEPNGVAARSWDTDLFLLAVPGVCWDISLQEWTRAGMVPQRTLVCVDQPLDAAELGDLPGAVDNLVVSPHPVDPLLLGLALSCMAGHDPAAAPFLGRPGQTRQQQLISSSAKTDTIDALVADVKGAGARRPVRTALREIANEMVMNAFFNAPVDGAGNRRNAGRTRSSEVVLEPAEQPTLRWAVGERFVLLAVKDPFGSLSAAEIIRNTTGPSPQPKLGSQHQGAGIGLHIMARSAHHLLYLLKPGVSTEIVALVDRNPAAGAPRGSSLCILQGADQQPRQLGAHLWYTVSRGQDMLRIRLRGEIDESSDLRPIFELPGFIWLDMSGIKGINSVGIRAWLEAFRAADEPPRIFFERCSPAVVSQINMIPAFAETGRLLSLHVPYFCPSCGEEFSDLLAVDQVADGAAPDRFCGGCGGDLEFDGLPAQYFAFTAR